MSYRCWAEVDLDALRENLAWIRHRVGNGVQIMTVVKADAYGHGLQAIAAHLMRSGTDVFGVANLAEARAIRAVGRGWPILMLGACLPEEVDAAVKDGVKPTVSSWEEAEAFSRAAVRQRKTVSLHVKVDTGMGRLGVPSDGAAELVTALGRLPKTQCEGLYTHYASAEDGTRYSRMQRERFLSVIQALEAQGLRPPLIHANNSAGLLHEPDSLHNLVRPGLLVYGVMPEGRRRSRSELPRQLRPALSLKCRVGFIKAVEPGARLSYGGTYVVRRPMKVATLTVGYGDGFPRAGSNRARVLIRGHRCSVVGRVTMDQTLADVSFVPEVACGDEVILIGRQNKQVITATNLATWCGTIPWEVLTGISYRVPRVYRGAQAA